VKKPYRWSRVTRRWGVVGSVSEIVDEEDVVERDPAVHLEPGAFAFGYFVVEVAP
jgi:hypothetical protein